MTHPHPGLIRLFGVALGILVAQSGWASDGRITFSGAIVEPTCAAGAANLLKAQQTGSLQSACPGTTQTGQAAQRYVLSVTTAQDLAGDPLLGYFESYSVGPVLAATQVYE